MANREQNQIPKAFYRYKLQPGIQILKDTKPDQKISNIYKQSQKAGLALLSH
jgi:hypothetical protein